MKIVITGGGGFIGFKLAKALLSRGTLAAERIARLTLVDQAFSRRSSQGPAPCDARRRYLRPGIRRARARRRHDFDLSSRRGGLRRR